MRKRNGGMQHFLISTQKQSPMGNKTLMFKVKGRVHSETMSETTVKPLINAGAFIDFTCLPDPATIRDLRLLISPLFCNMNCTGYQIKLL